MPPPPQPDPSAEAVAWLSRRTYAGAAYPLQRLLEAKRESISVVLPAKEVAETLPGVLTIVLELREAGLVDEVLVVDAASRDGTADVARRMGASVAQESELLASYGRALGKGDAMWRGLSATSGDLVAYLDTDSVGVERGFVLGLLGPLVCEPGLSLVKGAFERPFQVGDAPPVPHGGGRVTELLARPWLNLHVPELAGFLQPLAGEVVARRSLLERLAFPVAYGVEIAMLIDALRLAGLDGLAQVQLGERRNRHQSLRELGTMAYGVLVAAERRVGHAPDAPGPFLLPAGAEIRRVPVLERPPLAAIGAGRARAETRR